MAERRNYILGKGELLARNEKVKLGFGEGEDPYSFTEQRRYIAPLAATASQQIDALPRSACPNDEAVAVLTLHPKYLSKSAYPNDLLSLAGFRVIGSKAVSITPRKSHLKEEPKLSLSSEMYLAGSRASFRRFSTSIEHLASTSSGAADLLKVESFRVATPQERIKPIAVPTGDILFEVILHAGKTSFSPDVLSGFRTYLQTLGIDVNLDERLDAEDLSFVPVRTTLETMRSIAEFSFLRMAREMPHIREFWPIGSAANTAIPSFPISLPTEGVLDPTIRVAVFDGGCPDIPALSQWVSPHDGENLQAATTAGLRHGLSVTSALLFGSLVAGEVAPRPFATIDHYRVVDGTMVGSSQGALYPILKRIIAVLTTEEYDFINFSIGPAAAIDDGDINPWTALIDPILSSGKTLATVAVGNGGLSDAVLQLNRIQPPSDCVNALSVGARDDPGKQWQRSPYSSVGHGRCPGVMKPDGVAFGGHLPSKPFNVIDYGDPSKASQTHGTSFSSPLTLRTAIGVRAQLGPVVSGLALKALLVHNCEIEDIHEKSEVGWGKFPTDVEALITCAKGKAHVIYQGFLDPKKFLRAEIPMPKDSMNCDINIKATLCFATPTDSQHPLTYTRNGLQIFFRRDRNNIPVGKTNPKSDGFFKSGFGMPEHLIRNDAHQWETVRHAKRKMRGLSLVNPCFDIHLNPRDEGHDTSGEKVPYAMVITIDAPRVPDLFEKIFDRYRFQLEELKPRFELPLQV